MQGPIQPKTAWGRSLARLADRLARERNGAAALEFALIAIPFLMLVMGVLEIAMLYLVSTTLENATSDAARQIRTGTFQNGSTVTAANFVSQICSELDWLGSASSCSSNLFVDVRTYASYTAIAEPNPISNQQITQASLTFAPGAAGSIVMVRAFYRWQLFTPGLDLMVATLNGGSTLISATAAFKNEPYGSSS
jgi:Flp pilus assembly protein TadG